MTDQLGLQTCRSKAGQDFRVRHRTFRETPVVSSPGPATSHTLLTVCRVCSSCLSSIGVPPLFLPHWHCDGEIQVFPVSYYPFTIQFCHMLLKKEIILPRRFPEYSHISLSQAILTANQNAVLKTWMPCHGVLTLIHCELLEALAFKELKL